MKRRFINTRRLLLGGFLLFTVLVVTTGVLLPLERAIIDAASLVVLGFDAVANERQLTISGSSREPMEARVIGKRSNEFQDVLIIDESVPEGTLVHWQGTLVGSVTTQAAHSSKVRTIASPLFTLEGVFERSGIPSEFVGKGAGILETRVPRGSDVAAQDVIREPTRGELVIGTVVNIVDVPSNPFLTVIVLHPLNTTTLNAVRW